jgi:hypothetical protein
MKMPETLTSCRASAESSWARFGAGPGPQLLPTQELFVSEMITVSESLGFEPPFESPGPLPAHDHCGCRTAILMVSKSTQPGRHSESHIQWDTIRKFRSTISNQSRASRYANFTSWSLTDYKGTGYDRLTSESCGSCCGSIAFHVGAGREWGKTGGQTEPSVHL